MARKTTQNDMVLEYIRNYGSITQLEAMADLGVSRLAARMSDLKAMGFDVHKTMATSYNRFGKKVSYSKYTIDFSMNGGRIGE